MCVQTGCIVLWQEANDWLLDRIEDCDLNVIGIHPDGGSVATASCEALRSGNEAGNMRPFVERVRKMGLQYEYEMHVLSWALPRSEFSKHPGWFRENEKGQRTCDFHMCVTNPNAREVVIKNVERLARVITPSNARYHLWPDDVLDAYCHCKNCRAYTRSDQALLLSHMFLEGIKAVDPTAKQCYLAYRDTMEPPKNVRPHKDIFLEFAPFDRNFDSSIADPDNIQNAACIRTLPVLLDLFGHNEAKVLEYWMDNSKFSNWKKPPAAFSLNTDVLRVDAEYYVSKGFHTITSFACFLAQDYVQYHKKEPPFAQYAKIVNEFRSG